MINYYRIEQEKCKYCGKVLKEWVTSPIYELEQSLRKWYIVLPLVFLLIIALVAVGYVGGEQNARLEAWDKYKECYIKLPLKNLYK